MKPLTIIVSTLSTASAINVRIGHTPWVDDPTFTSQNSNVAVYVYSDNWVLKDGGTVNGVFSINEGLSGGEPWRFCANLPDSDILRPGCPWQAQGVSLAGYGMRIEKDDGANFGKLLLNSWHNHNGQEVTNAAWCDRLPRGVMEGRDRMLWQCSMPNY
jgi:hypothetical protein